MSDKKVTKLQEIKVYKALALVPQANQKTTLTARCSGKRSATLFNNNLVGLSS